MHDDTVTIRWDETSPTGFEALNADGATLQDFLPATVAAAGLAGVTLTFDVYPRHSAAAGNPANAPRFAAWLATLARAYPSVTHYVLMNECNQPLFVSPQYDAQGNLVSAASCGAFLAAGYRALKAVDPDIFVWGLGLSPHGAKVDGHPHRDASPFDFLTALGTWYRHSAYLGQRIMDGLDLHPYPIPQSVPFAAGNGVAGGPAYGVATLPLVYRAFYDAFRGTGQPTVGPGRLPVSLNEVGVQTVPTVAGYTGIETPGWGVEGATGTEAYQAHWYTQLFDAAECDASITNVNVFKLLDQSDLGGWQSGLYQLGWVPKSSAQALAHVIAETTTCPTGPASYWMPQGITPGQRPAGQLSAFVLAGGIDVPSPDGFYLRYLRSVLLSLGPMQSNGTGSVTFVPVPARALSSLASTFPLRVAKLIPPPRMLAKPLPGVYRLRIQLASADGLATATLTTAPFVLGAGGMLRPGGMIPTVTRTRPDRVH